MKTPISANTDEPAPASPSALERPRRHLGAVVQAVCVAAALVHPVAARLGRYFWIADLFSHFLEAAIVATVLALIVAAWRRRFVVTAAMVVLAVLELTTLASSLGPNPVRPVPDAPRPLRILVANVLWDNDHLEDLAELVRQERPDILGLVEYTRECQQALSRLQAEYPYRVDWPAGVSGLALWFRAPPRTLGPPVWLVPRRNPVVRATFDYAGETRELWLVHPSSPMQRIWEPGYPELTALGQAVGASRGSRIVAGDLNTTDGSAHFADFLRATGLRDSRIGFGRQGTWPSLQRYRIAIDHVLVSDDLAVVDRRLGPLVGSDHLPVIIDLVPAAGPASRAADQASGSLTPQRRSTSSSASANRASPPNLARSAR